MRLVHSVAVVVVIKLDLNKFIQQIAFSTRFAEWKSVYRMRP